MDPPDEYEEQKQLYIAPKTLPTSNLVSSAPKVSAESVTSLVGNITQELYCPICLDLFADPRILSKCSPLFRSRLLNLSDRILH
jgi:hypothetical protein